MSAETREELAPARAVPVVHSLSLVIPHWPLDEETNVALRRCVSSFPAECERIVVVNDGTGYGRNVNVGLRVAGKGDDRNAAMRANKPVLSRTGCKKMHREAAGS